MLYQVSSLNLKIPLILILVTKSKLLLAYSMSSFPLLIALYKVFLTSSSTRVCCILPFKTWNTLYRKILACQNITNSRPTHNQNHTYTENQNNLV